MQRPRPTFTPVGEMPTPTVAVPSTSMIPLHCWELGSIPRAMQTSTPAPIETAVGRTAFTPLTKVLTPVKIGSRGLPMWSVTEEMPENYLPVPRSVSTKLSTPVKMGPTMGLSKPPLPVVAGPAVIVGIDPVGRMDWMLEH